MLTAGPMDFGSPVPNKQRNKLFVIDAQPRGELVSYDWLTWLIPKGLWRSRTDGSERLQLSFTAM